MLNYRKQSFQNFDRTECFINIEFNLCLRINQNLGARFFKLKAVNEIS